MEQVRRRDGRALGYLETLRPLPEGAELSERLDGDFDWVQIFVNRQADRSRSRRRT